MEAMNLAEDKATIVVSVNELIFLCNAINETLEAVEDWEFESRTGETRTRALEMHAHVQKILREVQSL